MPLTVLDEYQPGTAYNTCYLCRASKRPGEMVIDTGVHIDFEGFVAFCSSCIEEAASKLGMLSKRRAEKLRRENEELAQRLVEAQVRAEQADMALRALRAYDRLPPGPGPSTSVPGPDPGPGKVAE